MKILPFFVALIFLSACEKNQDTIQTLPSIDITDVSVTEGDARKAVYVQLMLSEAAKTNVSVFLSTKDGSASAGVDFEVLLNERVEFLAGQSFQEVKITILGDTLPEDDEDFFVELINAEGASIGTQQARITILNDEQANPTVIIPQSGYTTPLTYDNWDLIWQDEFSGNALNTDTWTYEIGTGNSGWGNNESQYYRKENTSVQNGCLVIEARQETFAGRPYTSSRIITQNAFDFKYGRVDIRAALPIGQGIWPALWMLGSNFSTIGWPSCGEIDIMELLGHEPNIVHGTAHWSNAGQHASYSGYTTLPSGTFHEKFHVFSIVWNEAQINWFVDDKLYHTINITPNELSEFHQNFFFIFNVAVGGNWPGYPNATTTFPQRMIVDYVRVFQKS